MRLTSAERERVKKTYQSAFKTVVNTDMKWVTGERQRSVQVFTKVSEAMGLRDPSEFETVLKMFEQYLVSELKKWLTWARRDANNRIGFVDKTESIYIFVSGKAVSVAGSDKDLNIAGTAGDDDWDF